MLRILRKYFIIFQLLLVSYSNICYSEILPKRSIVIMVNDGDTVKLMNGKYVRLIGIDTPEKEEEYYSEAKCLCTEKSLGRVVRLEYDRHKFDKYDRILAYLFFEENGEEVMLNELIIERGFGHLYVKDRRIKYFDRLLRAQRKALSARLGIWVLKLTDTENSYVSSKKSAVFHRPGCPWARRIRQSNVVRYETKYQAYWQGLSPCRGCAP